MPLDSFDGKGFPWGTLPEPSRHVNQLHRGLCARKTVCVTPELTNLALTWRTAHRCTVASRIRKALPSPGCWRLLIDAFPLPILAYLSEVQVLIVTALLESFDHLPLIDSRKKISPSASLLATRGTSDHTCCFHPGSPSTRPTASSHELLKPLLP
jgi:hypothetical protein